MRANSCRNLRVLCAGLLVLVSGCPRNRPPGIPDLVVAPTTGPPLLEYEFGAVACDPDEDSVAVRFDWGDGDTSSWSAQVASGETAFMNHGYGVSDTYYVTCQSRDASWSLSGWMPARAVDMTGSGNARPEAPSKPEGPASAMVAQVCTLTTVATDPDSGSVSVRFDWGDGDTSGWSQWQASGSSFTAARGFDRASTLIVRAQARDWGGGVSAWSEPLTVTVAAGTQPGEPIWRLGASGSSPALATDGTIYIVTGRGLYAVSSDGTMRWRFDTPCYQCSSPSVGSDGTVYYWAVDTLYAVNADGTRRWAAHVDDYPHPGSAVPAIGADGSIYAAAGDTLYAFSASGSPRWAYPAGGSFCSAPAIGPDGTVYAGCWDRNLYAVRPDGSLRWKYFAEHGIGGSVSVGEDGTVYFGCDSLHALNPDGSRKWSFAASGWTYATPSIGPDSTIHFGCSDGIHFALNLDGSERWRYIGRDRMFGSPAIAADGTIYTDFGFDFGALRSDGTLWWQIYAPCWAWESPVIGPDGTVYWCVNGYLYAFVGNSPLAQTAWPMFGHDPQHTCRYGYSTTRQSGQ